jgi:hypothetical protein
MTALPTAFDATKPYPMQPAEFLLEVGDMLTRDEFFIEVRRLLQSDSEVSEAINTGAPEAIRNLADKVREAIGPEAEMVVGVLHWHLSA